MFNHISRKTAAVTVICAVTLAVFFSDAMRSGNMVFANIIGVSACVLYVLLTKLFFKSKKDEIKESGGYGNT